MVCGAANVSINGLGAGDTEVSLGRSSLPATLSLPDSNHQTSLAGTFLSGLAGIRPVFTGHVAKDWASYRGLNVTHLGGLSRPLH